MTSTVLIRTETNAATTCNRRNGASDIEVALLRPGMNAEMVLEGEDQPSAGHDPAHPWVG